MPPRLNAIPLRLSADERVWLERHGRPLAEQLRNDLGLLQALLRRSQAELAMIFTSGEALLMCDAFQSTFIDSSMMASAKSTLGNEIEDAIALEHLDAKWDVDAKVLIGKLLKLRDTDAAAVLEMIQLFWADDTEDLHLRAAKVFRTR